MNPIIRNVSEYNRGPGSSRLVKRDDGPPTCTMSYSEILPNETSSHHSHVWEHEVFIIEGTGTLFCDGKTYPVKAGDGLFIPPNSDHYTLNNGGQGKIKRIEVNPIDRTGEAKKHGAQPPVIRNHSELNKAISHILIGSQDGAQKYVMLHNNPMLPGSVSHPDTQGHSHPWEHVVFILDGTAKFICDGNEYTLSKWDGMLVPQNTQHQWKNESDDSFMRVTFNPVASENLD